MSTGLLALLDDVAALVKMSAASLDDISAQVSKSSIKVSGIVIDDAAVTPKYVVGLDPARELAIIYHITKKSIFNKIVFLAPAALLLGFFLPWIIQPILMLGGAYLCFEGYEKVHSIFAKQPDVDEAIQDNSVEKITPEELEKIRVTSAVRTDFILSAEIMAITYSTVADQTLMMQVIVLFCVAVTITAAVYGFVALIVKADDVGLYLAKGDYHDTVKRLGRGIVKFMPHFLRILSYVGTAAMLWVGAGIIAHGIPFFHHGLESVQHSIPGMPVVGWLAQASICAIGGLILGAILEKLIKFVRQLAKIK